MSEVKFKTLKVFDSLDVPQKFQDVLERQTEIYPASNGTYFPFWVKDDCDFSLWLLKQGAVAEEKVLIYWNW